MNAELGLAATELVRVSEGSSEVIERNSIDGLVQHAQNIASQLQGLVNHQSADEDALIACNDEIPYSELLRRLSTTLERQRTINEATSRMAATNYVVNVANYIRNRQLASNVQGKVQKMQTHIETLESTVNSLNTDVSVQKAITERFKNNLDSTRKLLEATITNYREEMARQIKILQEQQEFLDSIKKSATNQALLIDSALLVSATYVSYTPIISFPINIVSKMIFQLSNNFPPFRQIDTPRRSRRIRRLALVMFLRTFLVYFMLNWGRRTMENYGLYRGVGGWFHYFKQFIDLRALRSLSDGNPPLERSPTTTAIPPT